MAEEKVHKKKKKPEGKICESAKRELLFSVEDMESALKHECCRSKESYTCPNEMKCQDVFSRTEGPGKLRRLRSLIWLQNPGSEVAPTLKRRRNNFVDLLKSMARTEDNRIMYCFEGKRVCKNYFRVRNMAICICVTPCCNIAMFRVSRNYAACR
jgi:hypothetical protein